MTKAITSQTSVAYIVEVTDGTTPASPAFTTLRVTGESLSVDRKLVYSSELNGKRGEKNFAVAGANGVGNVEFEWTDATLEAMLESALRAAWNTDVLVDGNTPKSFTLETRNESGGTDLFKRLKGAQVNTLSLNMRPGEIVTGSLGMMARIADWANAIVASATYGAGNTEPIQVGANIGAITLAGLTFDHFASLTMSINNNLRFQEALNGSLNPVGIGAGKLEITGQFGLFVDSTMFNVLEAFQGGVATGLAFQIGNEDGKKTLFEIPNVVLDKVASQSESAAGDVMALIDYRALQDFSELSGSVIRVTRNVDES